MAIGGAHHDDRALADHGALEVARVRDLGLQADVAPVALVEEAVELALVALLVGVDGEGNAAGAAAFPVPAVSNALRRLRDLLDDELFLRTPSGMAPTPYALQLAEPVAQALRGLQGALNVRASFDPARSERCFTLAMTDVGEIYFLPVLMDALAREAPGVTLRCVPVADAIAARGHGGRPGRPGAGFAAAAAGGLLPAGAVPPALCGADARRPPAGHRRAGAAECRPVPPGRPCARGLRRHRPRPGGRGCSAWAWRGRCS
jgi:DNA-binding transcriptional LysR family regulator